MIKTTKITIGSGMDDDEEETGECEEDTEEVKEGHIKKINNGYLLSTCGPYSENQAEFVKKLSMAPAVFARLMGIKDRSKGYFELKDAIKAEDVKSKK